MTHIALRTIAKAPVARGYRANLMLTGDNIQSLADAATLVYVVQQKRDGFYCEPVEISDEEFAKLNASPVEARQGYASKRDDWSSVVMAPWGKDF